MHLLLGTNSLCLFAQPLLFLASVLHLKLTFSVLRINNYFPASVVSQKAPLIFCAYVKVRLIEMQYIIIIIIIIAAEKRTSFRQGFRRLICGGFKHLF